MRPHRLHHVGITVSDLDRSVVWYTEVFGLLDTGMRAEGGGPDLSEVIEVPGADLKAAFLRLGEQLVELLQYRSPEGAPLRNRPNDPGAVHVGFEVDDIQAAYERMSASGVEFFSPPFTIDAPGENLHGLKIVYLRDPDGVAIELYEVPEGGPR